MQLPLTEKDELRAACTPDEPIGAHLCATASEIVRVYSTSGTTGTPSYIPLTAGDLDGFGDALHRGWEMKRSIGAGISYARIDDWYTRARTAGAIGGKLAGAGGGGFLVLYCPKPKQDAVRVALAELKEVDFKFDQAGARIAFAQ